MRFYAIVIDNAPTVFSNNQGGKPLIDGAQFCSVIDVGRGMENDPYALRCQMHYEMGAAHTASANNAFVRLWGVDIKMLSQSSDLTGLNIHVYGGFWGGGPKHLALELAQWEDQFRGLMIEGQIMASIGNWVGSDMTLDIFIQGGPDVGGGAAGGADGGSAPAAPQQTATALRMASRQRIGRHRTRLRAPVSPTQFDNPLAGITGDINTLISAFTSFTGGGWMQTPLNLIHNMMPGMSLDSVITQTLKTAFPNAKIVNLMKGGLSLIAQDAGFYGALSQYAGYVKSLSKAITNGGQGVGGLISSVGGAIGGDAGGAISSVGSVVSKVQGALGGGGASSYEGVNIFAVRDKIFLHDGSQAAAQVQLMFIDLIGQPTWVEQGTINFMTPMRCDIYLGVSVSLPNDTLQTITPNEHNMFVSDVMPRSLSISFSGAFSVTRVQVIGDSRHPDGKSWALSIDAKVGGAAGNGSAQGAPGAPSPGGAQTTAVRLMQRQRATRGALGWR